MGGEKRLELLGDYQREAKDIAAKKGGRSKAALARELAVDREECASDVLMLAKLLKVSTGKVNIFFPFFVSFFLASVGRSQCQLL